MIDYNIYALGDSAITIEFSQYIDPKINDIVISFSDCLKEFPIEGVLDIIPSYSSVSLVYDVFEIRKKHKFASKYIIEQLKLAILECNFEKTKKGRIIEIPVCYDVSFGIDLELMATDKNLSIEEIIAIHTSKSYRVYLAGFIPGFPYMGIVDERITTPRKKSPRTKIEAGSVGIAANQTGIYPFDSPGGWNIIGKTPIKMFDTNRDSPVYLEPGDEVIYKSISLEEFKYLESKVKIQKSENNQKEKLIDYKSILITKNGIADSFQDLGRFGFQHLGVNPNGAMDKIAAQTANFLVGNSGNEAVLECHYPACTLLFNANSIIAISGADFTPTINDLKIPLNSPVFVCKGSILAFKKWKTGTRTYIAVQNGYKLEKWLGSYSTNIKAVAGGFYGRYLKKGDEIEVKSEDSKVINEKIRNSLLTFNFSLLPWHVEIDNLYNFEEIEIVLGNDYKFLSNESKIKLLTNEFLITASSDRMGYRLSSEELKVKSDQKNFSLLTFHSSLSSAVTRGTMQLLPNGQIIILMGDHQTTGGYPKIGHVTSASFSSLAQISVNKKIRFKIISLEESEEKYMQQLKYLRQLQIGCKLSLNSHSF